MLPFTDILKFKKSIAKLRGHLKGKEKTSLFTFPCVAQSVSF